MRFGSEARVLSESCAGCARQRTPLTIDQIRQLDHEWVEPQLGVVREMVRQLEQSGPGISLAINIFSAYKIV